MRNTSESDPHIGFLSDYFLYLTQRAGCLVVYCRVHVLIMLYLGNTFMPKLATLIWAYSNRKPTYHEIVQLEAVSIGPKARADAFLLPVDHPLINLM